MIFFTDNIGMQVINGMNVTPLSVTLTDDREGFALSDEWASSLNVSYETIAKSDIKKDIEDNSIYIVNEYNSLIQLSKLLLEIHNAESGADKKLFGVIENGVNSSMRVTPEFEINFTVDKIAEIKTLIQAMDNSLSEAVIDATANALINAGSMTFETIFTQMNVTTRDYAYMVANGFISE